MESSPGSGNKVDKVAVATKHPGVFVETSELEKETGKKLPVGIELKEVVVSLVKVPNKQKEQSMGDGEVEVSSSTPVAEPRQTRSSRRSNQQKPTEEEEVKAPSAAILSGLPGEDQLSEGGESAVSGTAESESVCSSSTTRSSGRRVQKAAGQSGGSSIKTKTTKGKVAKGRAAALANGKGKSRRHIFKKSAARAPMVVARTVTSDRVYYKGQFFTKGDIVSVTDLDDNGTYYAQLRGFLTDQYCQKSGVITWLLPTTESPPPDEGFDPPTYVIGPEEELPRRLECFTFVMHAPDDYYQHKNAPYPTRSEPADQEYVLTRAGPKVRLIKHGKAIYRDRYT